MTGQIEDFLSPFVDQYRREVAKHRLGMEHAAEEEAGVPAPWKKNRTKYRAIGMLSE